VCVNGLGPVSVNPILNLIYTPCKCKCIIFIFIDGSVKLCKQIYLYNLTQSNKTMYVSIYMI